MKIFRIIAQERPWYGSAYYERAYEARNESSALKKAVKEYPNCVWFWINGQVVFKNKKVMEKFEKANPGMIFQH